MTSIFQNRKIFLKNILNKKIFETKDNILYFYPVDLLPLSRFPFVKTVNLKLASIFLNIYANFRFIKNKKILWMFYPHLVSLTNYFKKNYTLVYDIIDFYTDPNPKKDKLLFEQKKELLIKADIVTAISNTLKKQYSKIFRNKKITVIPQGFNLNKIRKNIKIKQLENLKNIVGYTGALNERLDYNLLLKLISKTPKINYVFVGPIEENPNFSAQNKKKEIKKLFSFKNFVWLDQQPKEKIPSIIKYFDVCIIPYDILQKFNKFCYPMKLFEYFYAEKPVVSTPIEELKYFDELVKIGKDADEWQNHINHLLKNKWPKNLKEIEKKLAKNNSWKNKIEKISSLL